MEPILEFNYLFEGDEEEHIINIQAKSDSLLITIELESKGLYWYKELNSKLLSEITSQMGSYKSLKIFTDMLIQALAKKNKSLSLNFYSLKEIQDLSNYSLENKEITDVKKFLILVYTSFEKVIYPIPMDYLGNNPTKELMQRTIIRLRNRISKLKEENKTLSNNSSFNKSNLSINNIYNNNDNIPINYNEFERLKEENENLNKQIKLMKEKSVNDDIFKKYNELQEKYDTYKKQMENKMNLLVSSLEELKDKETEKLNQEKEKEKNKALKNNKNISKILELEKKLEISSEQLLNERKQNSRLIEEKNREIDSLKKDIKLYKETDKTLKVKITNLEKELEREKKGTSYYKKRGGGNTPSRRAKSYQSENSVSMNESYISSYSKKTTTSYLKKNLIPTAYKNSYLRAKNYSPYGAKKNNSRKNSKSKSRSGSKKSSGSNSFVAKSIKGPNTVYQRSYKSPYKYEPKKNNVIKKNSNSKNKIRNSPSKNLIKKDSNNINNIKNQNLNKNYGYSSNNYENNEKNNKANNIININNNENDKKDNLNNDDSNNIADRLSRIQALISQVSGK